MSVDQRGHPDASIDVDASGPNQVLVSVEADGVSALIAVERDVDMPEAYDIIDEIRSELAHTIYLSSRSADGDRANWGIDQ